MKKLKVRKLYASPSMGRSNVIQAMDGKFYWFSEGHHWEFRESDLHPLPGFRPVGRNGEEAPKYMYFAYGLEKCTDGLGDMEYADAVQLAARQPDLDQFMSGLNSPRWKKIMGQNPKVVKAALRNIHRTVNMSVRDMVQISGLTQADFARHFLIPIRTLENWVNGRAECPLYTKMLMAQDLDILSREAQPDDREE